MTQPTTNPTGLGWALFAMFLLFSTILAGFVIGSVASQKAPIQNEVARQTHVPGTHR